GSQTLNVTFTPTDTTTYNSATASVTLTVNKASATVTLGGLSATYDGTAKSATATTTPAGKSVTFTYNGSAAAPTAAGSYTVVGTVTDPNYTGSATGTLVIAKATPVITWATPSAVAVGTALSSTQLNAGASVPGTFIYTPAAGTVLDTAGSVTLKADFTPTDTTNYTTATKSVSITVNTKQAPVITWATPTAITYGTALSATQLNAQASVPGTFTYSPAAGAILDAGSRTLTATFTPDDTTNYTTTTASVTLTVDKAAATVTLGGLSATYDGTAKSATATTTPAGKSVTFTYNGSATVPSAAGSYTVVGTVADPNYTGSATGTLVIARATPTIAWATPSAVAVGTALSSTQLNATASVPGTFVYTPAAGTVLDTAGTVTLKSDFTPTDTTNYATATATVSLTVNAAPNQAPTMTAIPAATITAPAAFSYQVTAADPENQTLSYTLAGNPSGMTISSTGLISWPTSVAGTYTITVKATDPGGLSASQSFTLTVSSAATTNQAPVISSQPVTNGYKEGYYYYQVQASDPDGDALRYSLAARPSGMTINAATGLIYWRPESTGTYTVTVKVTDPAGLSATQSYRLAITDRPSNSSPRITSTPVTTATVDAPYAYDVQATDYNGDTLYYRLTSAPSGMTIDLATGLITWTPTASQVGDRSVSVEVVDSKGGRATQSFTVKVTSSAPAANNPPTFTSIPVTAATAGSAYAYDVNATDPDGDPLTYTLASAPSGMVISSSTGIIGWIPTSSQTGSSTVTVEVADGRGGTATQSFTVTVGESTANNPPTFTSAPVTTAVKRQIYRYEANAVDPNGDTVTYSLSSKPEGMSIDSSTGVITWYPRSTGNYKVTVRARDSKGSTAYQSFTLKVVESISADKLSVGDATSGTTPAGTTPALNCDVNGDGSVTYNDLIMILAGKGKSDPRLDIDGDGIVTLLDARACVSQLR
ncbi:putative Ig domain-containing protein, partial [Geobacter sp.]|uniref:putative Ig domain-containing protein n=1 Tax=Geobacter sp. TaxID=46610 RepID=UPI002631EE10